MCESCETETVEQPSPLLSTGEVQLHDADQPVIFFEPFEISTENLAEDVQYNKDEFNRGLKDGSYVSGLFTALINSGVDLDSATTFILNSQNVNMNLEIAKIQANANVEVSKNKTIMVENTQL